MRIVTWNMGCGPHRSGYRKHHDDAWAYLLGTLEPDVAFVQEALLANLRQSASRYTIHTCDLADGVDAGTAVLVRTGIATTVGPTVSITRPTYVATATVTTPMGTLDLISIHVFPGDQQHADLARLVELAGEGLATRMTVLGGDFNAARKFGPKHVQFFDGIQRHGLHDAHWGKHGREGWSFWGHQAKEKYQDDHFFVSRAWESRIVSCDIIDDASVRRLSDHGPVSLVLDVQ